MAATKDFAYGGQDTVLFWVTNNHLYALSTVGPSSQTFTQSTINATLPTAGAAIVLRSCTW